MSNDFVLNDEYVKDILDTKLEVLESIQNFHIPKTKLTNKISEVYYTST